MSETRRFSRSQRLALFQAADGKCQSCGAPLDASFHADHIQPYSGDGETDVLNGQALCASCNLKKGARMPIHYRTWQDEQFTLFQQSVGKWFMMVVTPGGGKTIAMLRSAKFSLDTGETDFLIVVVPTDSLKSQWKKKAREAFGINLFSKYEGYVTEDFDGVIITYQQMAKSPGMVRVLHKGRKTFVILDEPHHMADGKSWGTSANDALQPSIRGILGTGTPFRTDQYPIPFVDYDLHTKELVAHYEYNYDDALIDQVVRALFFRKIGAEATWYSYTDEVMTASFDDPLDERQVQERLNAVINARSEFVRDVLKQSYAEIVHMRRIEQPNAKLLVIGKDTTHIDMLAQIYREITGDDPLIVSSAEEHGDKVDIESFKDDERIAIFAVDMVSEGVDIPQLRSLVYLTNVTAPLYFYQAIGRVGRVEAGRELLNGYVYLPSDPRLLALANTIKQRRIAVLKEFPRCQRCGQEPCICEKPARAVNAVPLPLFDMIRAVPVYDGGVYDDEVYTESEWKEAEQWKQANGFRIPTEEACKIRRKSQVWRSVEPAQASAAPDPEITKSELGKTANRYAFRLAEYRSTEVKLIHYEWQTHHNGKPHKQATISELKLKIEWLKGELHRHVKGGV